MKLNRNSKLFLNYFLGPVLFVWLSVSIYREIMLQPDLEKTWEAIRQSFRGPLVWNGMAVIALMFVNWGIEAVKWKISVRKIQDVGFFTAFKAVLSGVSFAVSTPNRMGEYLGRVLYMDAGNKLKTISITIVGSISQLIITLLMGCIGLVMLQSRMEATRLISPVWMQVILYGSAAALIFLTLFYFRLSWIVKWVDRLPGSRRFAYLINALEDFDATLLGRLLSLSLLRFAVFIVQYYLLFRLFDVQVTWWQGFWSVSVSFLVMAVIPTFAIAELGIRGRVGLVLTGLFSANKAGIMFATAGIWFINLVVPAVAGSLLILSIKKIYKEKNEKA